MKVKELIDILSKYDIEKEVILLSGVGEVGEIEGVEQADNIKTDYGIEMPFFNYLSYKEKHEGKVVIWTNECINE